MKKLTAAVIGGDLRFISLARALAKRENIEVTVSGFEKSGCTGLRLPEEREAADAAHNADAVILPLKATVDGKTINAPFAQREITIEEVLLSMKEGSLLFGGLLSEEISGRAKALHIEALDYFLREELAVLNTIPTAEGAVEIALAELPITLWNSKALVCGYGRVGKTLSRLLLAFGAKVTVAARKKEDFAWCAVNGLEYTGYESLGEKAHDFDLVFNTVPHLIWDDRLLSRTRSDVLIIDLASKPGGGGFGGGIS